MCADVPNGGFERYACASLMLHKLKIKSMYTIMTFIGNLRFQKTAIHGNFIH